MNIEKMPKNFDSAAVEEKIYDKWLSAGSFHAEPIKGRKPYTIVMPPPNITGQLHMGHALDNSIQDIIIRWKRMQGYEALWLPGTDHASIATEAKIVEALRKEGIGKAELGREGFLKKAWEWKKQYGGRIVEQLKRLGSSCDWDRERFTMDEGCSRAVNQVFMSLYNKGLIYRGEKMVNWCCHCKTTISDAEVEHVDRDSFLWHVKYPYADGNGYIVIATTRPETMIGDTAVAVNPDDPRYENAKGRKLILPLFGREIPVIYDSYVDTEFGTGALKITPAHDPNDYEIGLRHDLEVINAFTDDGRINEKGGKYAGLSINEARKAVAADLKEQGYLLKTEKYVHNVGTCYRCGTDIEPKLSTQWFVSMKKLAEPAIAAVKEEKTVFVPERFSKIYYNWMENIQDWCISRQLWWGHRIPAYYCSKCGAVEVSEETPEKCRKCGSTDSFVQDEDTLDTWFSSALWPFSTLGWPEKTEELEYFYPTDTLVTGPDIIFFWVARMIFSGIEQMGETPFKTVYLHGIVRDSQGRKMSKSLNNGIDPIEIIEKYGADALRYSLIDGNAPGNDQRFREEKVKAGSAFINKVWNAARFVLQNLNGDEDFSKADSSKYRVEDRWILSLLKSTISEVTQNLEHFEFGIALAKINSFIWDKYCDWYIEMLKPRLNPEQDQELSGLEAKYVLLKVLSEFLKLLHPFMPFFTESLFDYLPGNEEKSLMLENWPLPDEYAYDEAAEKQMDMVTDAVRKIRNLRNELGVPQSRKAGLILQTESENFFRLFKDASDYLSRLAGISSIERTGEDFSASDEYVSVVLSEGTFYIAVKELVDFRKEIERSEGELSKAFEQKERLQKKLQNEAFVKKAPAEIVRSERERLEKTISLIAQLEQRIRELKKQL